MIACVVVVTVCITRCYASIQIRASLYIQFVYLSCKLLILSVSFYIYIYGLITSNEALYASITEHYTNGYNTIIFYKRICLTVLGGEVPPPTLSLYISGTALDTNLVSSLFKCHWKVRRTAGTILPLFSPFARKIALFPLGGWVYLPPKKTVCL